MISLRLPAGRAYPGAFRRLLATAGVRSAAAPAPRFGVAGDGRSKRPSPPLTSGEGECGHGSTHLAPSPVFVLAAARYGAAPSYAAALIALARTTDRVSAVHGQVSPTPRRRSPNRPAVTR